MGYSLTVSLRFDIFNLRINTVYKNLKKQSKVLANLDVQIDSSSLHGNFLAGFFSKWQFISRIFSLHVLVAEGCGTVVA